MSSRPDQPSTATEQDPVAPDVPRDLSPQDLADIVDGAAFLSAGGGGAKALGQELIKVMSGSTVRMIGVGDVADTDYVICSAYIGSPAAALKLKSPTFNSLSRAIEALEHAAGVKASHVVPGEIGAVNSIAPILAARDRGLSVVDADGCGRAVPLIAATTFGLENSLASFGAAVANDANDAAAYQTAVLSATTTSGLQGSIGALAMSAPYGALCGTALWLMMGAQLKRYAVPYCLSRSRQIGEALRRASGDYASMMVRLLGSMGLPARVLFDGSLLTPVSFTVHTQDAHDLGTVVLKRADGKGTVTVFSLNENILAYDSGAGAPVILMPDMMCWLGEDGATFDNAQLQSDIQQGRAKPMYAIGVEAVQKVGVAGAGGPFRDYPGIAPYMAAIMGAVGYAGAYEPFKA